MRTKDSETVVGLREPVRVTAVRGLSVRWRVGRAALNGSLGGAGAGPATLELSVDEAGPGSWRVSAWVRADDAERDVSRLLPPAPEGAPGWSRDAEGLEHLDLPGVLCATWRRTPGGIEVLYARSALPGALGLGGGRYELEGAALRG